MIEITKYKAVEKGTLVAFLDIKIQKWGNFFIRDITYFIKGDMRWISFPSQQYKKDDTTKYKPYNGFEEDSIQKKFQEKVMEAIDEYTARQPQQQEGEESNQNESELPF